MHKATYFFAYFCSFLHLNAQKVLLLFHKPTFHSIRSTFKMSKMAELIDKLAPRNGFSESNLEGVRFFKATEHIPRTPLLYKPGICIVAQGKKIGHLEGCSFQYDPNTYLVVSVIMPFECETFSTIAEPLLGLYIDIDIKLLLELISNIDQDHIEQINRPLPPRAMGPAKLDKKMSSAIIRLLEALQSETESKILGKNIIKEITYRALMGGQAAMLYALAARNGSFSKVNRALTSIHKNYSKKFSVEELADQANMSVSAFHRAFKEVTTESPVQYIKKFRLNLARELMQQNQMKAYLAASKVGYDSVSQFSREFKRYFGKSPAAAVK